MRCQVSKGKNAGVLLAYSAGKLHGESAVRVERHLSECPTCAAVGKAQSSVWQLLDTWDGPPVSRDFDRKLQARIQAAESASWLDKLSEAVHEFLRPILARPAFPLAAASFVIVAGFVFDHPGRVQNSPRTQAALHVSSVEIDKADVEQVEATLDDMEMLRQFDAKVDDTGKEIQSKSM